LEFRRVLFRSIKKAYDLNPNHPKIIRSLFAHYMMEGDEANAKMLLSKISVSSNLQAYYSDLFPEKGVVIVSSEKDAIPLYYLQLKKGKGKNVSSVKNECSSAKLGWWLNLAD
ncbi:hypothetical protein, partial [uncultured Pseudoalteromonas sp.]|uniref:hypothetical protein n=1 Tax=uncultured Pseudoalteromonas sp. TaxID=114053 RepID=UPI002618846E